MIKMLQETNLNWQATMNIVGILGFLLAILMIFIIKNRTNQNTIIYLSKQHSFSFYLKALAKNPQVWFIAAYTGILYVPMTLLGGTFGIPYLKSIGFTDLNAANVISLMWISHAIGALILGSLSDKIRRRPILIFSALASIILLLGIVVFTQQAFFYYTTL